MLSGRGLCDELITRPEESYWLCCVVVCDLETSWKRRPWPTAGCCLKNKQNSLNSAKWTTWRTISSIICLFESKLTIENKLLLYKAIIKPIWSYGIQLWGRAKPSNTQIIQRIQSKTLRIVFNAPWYVSNETLHKDSRIPFVEDEIIGMTNRYLLNLTGHSNEQVNQLLDPPEARRRLHRQWPTDVLQ